MPSICDNAYFQKVGEQAADFLVQPVKDLQLRRYVHVCNPYQVRRVGDRTQDVTYAAMHRARREGEAAGMRLEFLAAVFTADKSYASKFFDRTFPLKRSSKDVKVFGVERHLPLLFDIISGAEDSEADYIVFTNVDICPVPHFYRTIDAILSRGYDSLVINRRIILGWPIDPSLVEMMAIDHGLPHYGYDCFVFRREALAHFVRNRALVGAGGVMQSIIYNIVANSQRLLFLGDVHLTWHLGDDHPWQAQELQDYVEHNWSEAITTLHKLASANPKRFANFCRNFPHSRVEVLEADGVIRLRRKADCTGFLPDLEAVNRVV